MRRIAMKYKTSTTSSYHWCGAWGDIGGILALRAGGRRHILQRQRQHRNMLGSTKPLKLASLKGKYLIWRSHWRGWVGRRFTKLVKLERQTRLGWGRSLCDFTKCVLRRVCQYFHRKASKLSALAFLTFEHNIFGRFTPQKFALICLDGQFKSVLINFHNTRPYGQSGAF